MMKFDLLILLSSSLLMVRAEAPPSTPSRGGSTLRHIPQSPRASFTKKKKEEVESPPVRGVWTDSVALSGTPPSIFGAVSYAVFRNTLASLGTCAACVWFGAAKTTIFSPLWFASVAGILVSSFAAAFSAQPANNIQHDLHHQVYWPALFALHTFALSGPFLLGGMLLKSTSAAVFSTPLIITSIVTISVGCIVEVLAHVQDAWVFHKKSRAYKGLNNKVFSTSLVGGFAFLAAALNPSLKSTLLAVSYTALLVGMAVFDKWNQMVVYALQSVTAGWVAGEFMSQFQTSWTLLYFAQAFNIVRCSKRMLSGYTQQLHLLPSMYGWFSYIFPFGLALHRATKGAGIGTVLALSALSVLGTNELEQWMQRNYERKFPKSN